MKALRISKNEVVGLVSLLKGDFSNRNIDLILKSFCQRSKLDKQLKERIKDLLVLVVS